MNISTTNPGTQPPAGLRIRIAGGIVVPGQHPSVADAIAAGRRLRLGFDVITPSGDTVATEPEPSALPCAYCDRSTPTAEQAASPWDWPGKGRVTACKPCTHHPDTDTPDQGA